MRVFMYTTWPVHSTLGSGVSVVVRELFGRFIRSNIETELYSPDMAAGGELPPLIGAFGKNYYSVTAARLFRNLSATRQFRMFAENKKNNVMLGFDFDGCMASSGEIRKAVVCGSLLSDIVKFESGMTANVLRILAMMERKNISTAQKAITPSQYAANVLTKDYSVPENKIAVIPNGFEWKEWSDRYALAKALPRFNNSVLTSARTLPAGTNPPGGKVVFTCARLYRRKGIDLLIRAFKQVVETVPGSELWIAGDGLERANLLRLTDELGLDKSVLFIGDVTDRLELAHLYSVCDVFALPSRHETFGLVYIEALAIAKPVVACSGTAVSEVFRDGKDGLLVPSDNEHELANAIISILRGETTGLGEDGPDYVKSMYDWSVIFPQYVKLLEEIA